MDKVKLRIYTNHVWGIGEVWKNGKKIAEINRFYEVREDFILIFGESGVSGFGLKKGALLKKIFIGDCEFNTIYHED